jgi:predicted transcriptional regulator
MILELKPEQIEILELAKRSGMSQEEVVDRAFAVIREQLEMDEWMLANRDQITAQIEEGYAQAQRGELIDGEEVVRILREDRAQRQKA